MWRSPKGTIRLCLMGQEMGVYTPRTGTKLTPTCQSWGHVGVFKANASYGKEKQHIKKTKCSFSHKRRKQNRYELISFCLTCSEKRHQQNLIYQPSTKSVSKPVCGGVRVRLNGASSYVCVQLGWGSILLFHSSRVTNRINSGLPTEQGTHLLPCLKKVLQEMDLPLIPLFTGLCAFMQKKKKTQNT